ncbi:hypothetical protein [Brachybacterium kimchii]|uniref:Uncharacterized protein n=1 Tax=Brachybacterium kimchii TaxID=2942909 RepID=A0ABY4NB78_9MICO|nr:hypothetical protein [Brachybacterium kimchii]UQN31791.1 hypothetical protein M4486_19570 [Brachybacterium kimchii]
MSNGPTAETRAIGKVLRSLLDPPGSPTHSDLRTADSLLIDCPEHGIPAFHYWAANADPDSPDPDAQLVRFIREGASGRRAAHAYRVCLQLAYHRTYSSPPPQRGAPGRVRITYLLWAAVLTDQPHADVLGLCGQAADVDLELATTDPLFPIALHRLGGNVPSSQEA